MHDDLLTGDVYLLDLRRPATLVVVVVVVVVDAAAVLVEGEGEGATLVELELAATLVDDGTTAAGEAPPIKLYTDKMLPAPHLEAMLPEQLIEHL